MKNEDKAEWLYQEHLKIINFNPDRDIVKIDGDHVHFYKWTSSCNIDACRYIFQEEEDDE